MRAFHVGLAFESAKIRARGAPGVVLSVALASLLPPRPCCAADDSGRAHRAALTLSSPPLDDCPAREALERAVEQRLSRRVFGAERPELMLRLGFERAPATNAHVARIALYDEQGRLRGERVLYGHSPKCQELTPSVVLVLALLVDSPPEPVQEAPAPANPEAPAPSGPPREAAMTEPENNPPTPLEGRRGFRFDAGLAAVAGTIFGSVSLGARASFGIEPPWGVLARAELTSWGSADADLSGSAAGARMQALSLSFALCPVRRWGRWGAWVCAGERTDWFQAEGFGFVDDRAEHVVGVSLEAHVGGSLTITGPLTARFGVGASGALRRPELRYASADGQALRLHALPVLAGELDLGFGLEFR